MTFVAVVDANPLDDEGRRILDGIEAAHGLNSEEILDVRRYTFTSFPNNAEAIAWLEAEALTFAADDDEHVEFGVPGKNAP